MTHGDILSVKTPSHWKTLSPSVTGDGWQQALK
jgi:hypothetical protein